MIDTDLMFRAITRKASSGVNIKKYLLQLYVKNYLKIALVPYVSWTPAKNTKSVTIDYSNNRLILSIAKFLLMTPREKKEAIAHQVAHLITNIRFNSKKHCSLWRFVMTNAGFPETKAIC